MFNTLVNAVRNRNVVSFRYEGTHRVGEPHIVGMTASGQELVLVYQTQGSYDAGGEGWVACNLDRVENLRLTGAEFFGPRHGYLQQDVNFIRINAQA